MICQFSFKNFMSYKDETVFDFQAAAIPELSESVISREKMSALLPVGVVYGPNGGLPRLDCCKTRRRSWKDKRAFDPATRGRLHSVLA